MKQTLLSLMLLCGFALHSQNGSICGDFDGDGELEYAYMTYPDIYDENDDVIYLDYPTTYIHFSKESIPTIRVDTCTGGNLQNLGDLNGDNRDEIGLWCGWPSSLYLLYASWTFDVKAWQTFMDSYSIKITLWETYGFNFKPIQKINGEKLLVYYTDLFDKVKVKEVKTKNRRHIRFGK